MALGSPNEAALFRIESRGFSCKLRSTSSMLSGVLEDRLGPGRGVFKAEALARNLCTQERIKFTLGPSLIRRIPKREQNCRRVIT